jgi:hypothetical protein
MRSIGKMQMEYLKATQACWQAEAAGLTCPVGAGAFVSSLLFSSQLEGWWHDLKANFLALVVLADLRL